MNKPLPTVPASQPCKERTPRAEAVRELEEEVLGLFTGCERALLMTGDLVEDYFAPFSEDVGKQDREKEIMLYFEENRIRAEILQGILYKMRATAGALNDELRRDAKEA